MSRFRERERAAKAAEAPARSPQPAAYPLVPDGWYAVWELHRLAPVTRDQVAEAVAGGAWPTRRGPRGQLLVEGRALIRWLKQVLREG